MGTEWMEGEDRVFVCEGAFSTVDDVSNQLEALFMDEKFQTRLEDLVDRFMATKETAREERRRIHAEFVSLLLF